jgi:hypothetical protein
MRQVRWLATVLAAVFALGAGASSSASAASKLVLRSGEGGPVLAPGSEVLGELAIETPKGLFCVAVFNASVVKNQAATDKLKVTGLDETYCEEPGASWISGIPTEVQLKANGTEIVKMPGKVVVEQPGGCRYDYKKFLGGFPTPGEPYALGESPGKRDKTSPPGCAKTSGEVGAQATVGAYAEVIT